MINAENSSFIRVYRRRKNFYNVLQSKCVRSKAKIGEKVENIYFVLKMGNFEHFLIYFLMYVFNVIWFPAGMNIVYYAKGNW